MCINIDNKIFNQRTSKHNFSFSISLETSSLFQPATRVTTPREDITEVSQQIQPSK